MKSQLIFLFSIAFVCIKAQVGVGTTTPQATLHAKGSLRLEHPSQSNGSVLRV